MGETRTINHESEGNVLATKIHFKKANRNILPRRQDHVPASQGNEWTEFGVGFLDQLQDSGHIRDVIARDCQVLAIWMGPVIVMGPPGARQPRGPTQSIPVSIGGTPLNQARRRIHVKENGIVVGGRARTTGAKDATQGCNIIRGRFGTKSTSTARNDAKGRKRGRGRQQGRDPVRILDTLLNDPITAVHRILKKMDTQAAFFVAMFDDNGVRRCKVGRYRNAARLALLQKGPLVFHLVIFRRIIQ